MQFEYREFKNVPEGTVLGVLVEVADLGLVESSYNGEMVRKCEFIFEVDEYDDNGRPLIVSRRFNARISEKSDLGKFIDAWLGRKLTPQERRDFTSEQVLGLNAILTIEHRHVNDKTYANIVNISQPLKGMKLLTRSEHYKPYAVRQAEREARRAAQGAGAAPAFAGPPQQQQQRPFQAQPYAQQQPPQALRAQVANDARFKPSTQSESEDIPF